MHHFQDATLGELEEILDLLPYLGGALLYELEEWVLGRSRYMPLDYESGARWLIRHLKGLE